MKAKVAMGAKVRWVRWLKFHECFFCFHSEYTSDNEKTARKLLKNVLKAIKGIRQAFKRAPRYKASMISKVVKFCSGFGYDTKDYQKLETLNSKIAGVRKALNKA